MADPENITNKDDMGDEGIPTTNSDNATVGIGGEIGLYKLFSILSEGGYEIVYLSEHQRQVRHRVVLKLIILAWTTMKSVKSLLWINLQKIPLIDSKTEQI